MNNQNPNTLGIDVNNLSSRKLWELLSHQDQQSLSRDQKQALASTLIKRKHYLSNVYHWQQQQLEILH